MVKVCRGTSRSRRALALASQLFARCARDGDASFGADDCAAAPPYPRGSRVLPLLVGRLHPLSTLQRASVHSPRWLRGALLHQSADHARRRRHAQMGREDGSRRRGSSCRGDQHWSPAGVPARRRLRTRQSSPTTSRVATRPRAPPTTNPSASPTSTTGCRDCPTKIPSTSSPRRATRSK